MRRQIGIWRNFWRVHASEFAGDPYHESGQRCGSKCERKQKHFPLLLDLTEHLDSYFSLVERQ